MSPPSSLFLFEGVKTPPCCWTFYDCEMQLSDTSLFTCVGTNLEHIEAASAIVKSQTCKSFQQYAGLQLALNESLI